MVKCSYRQKEEKKKKSRVPLELPGWELGWLGRTTFSLVSSYGRCCYSHLVNNLHAEVAGPPGGTLGSEGLMISLSC